MCARQTSRGELDIDRERRREGEASQLTAVIIKLVFEFVRMGHEATRVVCPHARTSYTFIKHTQNVCVCECVHAEFSKRAAMKKGGGARREAPTPRCNIPLRRIAFPLLP